MHDITLTRPIAPEDQAWIDQMRQLAATTCQCKNVTRRNPVTGEEVPWTWLEHCPLHTLTGWRYAG